MFKENNTNTANFKTERFDHFISAVIISSVSQAEQSFSVFLLKLFSSYIYCIVLR